MEESQTTSRLRSRFRPWAVQLTSAERLVHDRTTVVSLAVGLAAICLVTKIALLPFPVESVGEFVRWLLRLAIVSAADLCFVASLTIVCWVLTSWTSRGVWLSRASRLLALTLFLTAGIYGVVSVRVFEVTSEMITFRLLAFLGNVDVMASSVWAYVNPSVMRGLILVPLVLLLGFFLGSELKFIRRSGALSRKAVLCGLALVAAYGGVANAYVNHSWEDEDRWERRISRSPHATFLYSWVREMVLGDSLSYDLQMVDADESDFVAAKDPDKIAPCLPPNVERPKNVLLIVMESVSAEYLSLYGSDYRTTPRLERYLAENQNGVVFDNYYVHCPYSCKSLMSLTTGVYPRVDWKLIVRDNPDFGVPLINEHLADQAGFRGCYLHSGYWSWKYRDQYFGRRPETRLIDAETLPGPFVNSWGVTDEAMYEAALDWVDESEQPFFLMAFTIETHHPYVEGANPQDMGAKQDSENHKSLQERYLNAIRNADQKIVNMLQGLKDRGLDQDTLVVITSDHGESFGQHNMWLHGFGVYTSAVHTPLIMIHPSLAGYPRRMSQPCQQIDLPYTMAELVGVEPHESWQGRNLLDGRKDAHLYFFSLYRRPVLGMRDGRYKYHYYINTGKQELFDLRADPREKRNLADKQVERCKRYRQLVGGFVSYQKNFLAERGAR